MRKPDDGYDYHRYRQLLAEAVDDAKRLALIELLIEEKARDRLAAQRASDRAATTALTVAKVLGHSWNGSAPSQGSTARAALELKPLRLIKDVRQRA